MTKNINVMRQLEEKHDKRCHYCNRITSRSESEKYDRFPTKEHVVPRAFGGENRLENLVLACYACNQKRGTILFYCDCRDCEEKILDALYDTESIRAIFDSMIAHNKPRVRKRTDDRAKPGYLYAVRIGHHVRNFKTFQDAIKFATNYGSCVNDVEYNL